MVYRFSVLLFIGLIISCTTPKQATQSKTVQGIYGTWTYKESSGGFTGKGTGWGVPVTLHLSKDMTYERKENQQVVESDRFTLTKIRRGEDSVTVIDLVSGLDKQYRFSGDTLFLDELVSDGYSYVYLRAK